MDAARCLFLFLDYDGTLVPLADHPSRAALPEKKRRLLDQLSRMPDVEVAVISGRALGDLKKMVRLNRLCYVGNHGLELESPGFRYVNPVAAQCRPFMREMARRLSDVLRPIRGVWVEDKRYTLSVHCRSVPKEDEVLVKNGFYEVIRPYQEKRQARVTVGKHVFEVRPPVRWDKGTIVNWLLTRRLARMDGPKTFLLFYLGDDQTDEDAFETLRDRGITVRVGASSILTSARYAVRSPQDVERLLKMMLERRKKGRRRLIAANHEKSLLSV